MMVPFMNIIKILFYTTLVYGSLFYLGCNASFYGSNCDTPCPTNCKDNTCQIKNGTCFNCKAGWTEEFCNTSMITCFLSIY